MSPVEKLEKKIGELRLTMTDYAQALYPRIIARI